MPFPVRSTQDELMQLCKQIHDKGENPTHSTMKIAGAHGANEWLYKALYAFRRQNGYPDRLVNGKRSPVNPGCSTQEQIDATADRLVAEGKIVSHHSLRQCGIRASSQRLAQAIKRVVKHQPEPPPREGTMGPKDDDEIKARAAQIRRENEARMSRLVQTSPDADPVGWFFRLERAVRESDYLIANEARRQLSHLGWNVTHSSQRGAKKSTPQSEGVSS